MPAVIEFKFVGRWSPTLPPSVKNGEWPPLRELWCLLCLQFIKHGDLDLP